MNMCSPETLLKVGVAYPEMAAQEKSLDSLIELAKRDQLDENLPMDAIEKCCGYFTTMFSILFGDDLMANQARLVTDGTRTLASACDAIATDASAIKVLIDGEGGDIGTFKVDFISRNIFLTRCNYRSTVSARGNCLRSYSATFEGS